MQITEIQKSTLLNPSMRKKPLYFFFKALVCISRSCNAFFCLEISGSIAPKSSLARCSPIVSTQASKSSVASSLPDALPAPVSIRALSSAMSLRSSAISFGCSAAGSIGRSVLVPSNLYAIFDFLLSIITAQAV